MRLGVQVRCIGTRHRARPPNKRTLMEVVGNARDGERGWMARRCPLGKRRVDAMNARPTHHELHRIRRDIGSALRIEHATVEPAPQSLLALLEDLKTRVRDAEREKVFAEVEARVAELLRATGRQPRNAQG
jgi:hypothetical protein